MSSSYLPSRSAATHRRNAAGAAETGIRPEGGRALAPAPNPPPVFQLLAFGIILFLGSLQFLLSPTHFRDPSDPLRKWLPLNNTSSRNSYSTVDVDHNDDDGMVHIVSWIDCLDLPFLAVLANSTLSSSRYPELVVFHFFIPGGNEDKVSFYKLKVLFPHSNLEIYGQDDVKQVIRTAFPGLETNYEELVPFIIPTLHKFLIKFIYLSSHVIMKGRVEELIGVDLNNYAVAAAEDCSERLNTRVNSDVLDAIQRSASKSWVSETPYAKDACMPSLDVLLIDSRKLEKDFLEAVLWWSQVLHWRDDKRGLMVALTLYNKYIRLSSSWLVKKSTFLETSNSMVVSYDGPKYRCFKSGGNATLQSVQGNVWAQFLPSISKQILGS